MRNSQALSAEDAESVFSTCLVVIWPALTRQSAPVPSITSRLSHARGDWYDNAVAENFFINPKNELVHHCDFASREAARSAIFDYIEVFYNRQRRHQALGYVSPAQYEQQKSGVA